MAHCVISVFEVSHISLFYAYINFHIVCVTGFCNATKNCFNFDAQMAVDTLFLCFCEDHNMHADAPDGSGQQFYAPPSLLRYMTTDAVDAVGRRSSLQYKQNDGNSKISQISQADRQSYPEEAIPMNPYGPTTEKIED